MATQGAKKNRFDRNWMHEHVNDHWVKEAVRLGYRSRAAFKLIELAQRDQLFRPGICVVELGCAPGSWTQVLHQRLGPAARIVGIDLLPTAPIRGVTLVQGDFSDEAGLAAVAAALAGARPQLVLSDMAPNLSGIESADQARAVHLGELALEFAGEWLQPEGDLVVKAFQGEGFAELVHAVGLRFRKVYVRKPKASRDRSREVYVVAKGRLGTARGA